MSKRKEILQKLAESTDTSTYSAMMRSLNKEGDAEKRKAFMKSYLSAFDQAMADSLEDHQEVALLKAKQEINAG